MSERLDRMMKKIQGDGPIEKHILLLKLSDALSNCPAFGEQAVLEPNTQQRQWFAQVGALLKRLGIDHSVRFSSSFNMLGQYWKWATSQIVGQVMDAIEEIKLELELDDRSEIGTAYAPGDVYRFFADLKELVNSAFSSILIVDPYFNGEAFDTYLAAVDPKVEIKILADRYSTDIKQYVEKHQAQFKTAISLRQSKELHDRLIFIDDNIAWIMGGSMKDAGKKATYLIPLMTELALAKNKIYGEIWNRASIL